MRVNIIIMGVDWSDGGLHLADVLAVLGGRGMGDILEDYGPLGEMAARRRQELEDAYQQANRNALRDPHVHPWPIMGKEMDDEVYMAYLLACQCGDECTAFALEGGGINGNILGHLLRAEE